MVRKSVPDRGNLIVQLLKKRVLQKCCNPQTWNLFAKHTFLFVRKIFVHRPLPRFRADFTIHIKKIVAILNKRIHAVHSKGKFLLKRLKISFARSMIFSAFKTSQT